ncbi:MAG: type I secretion system permease/ATPase [Geminicoccaceae bacterium]|nr:type I secretion system permease/ATPase [Geminicoccaceae bacterium]
MPVALFSVGVNILALTAPLFMISLFQHVITPRSPDTLLFLTLIAAFALIVMGSLDVLRNRILVRVGIWFDQKMSPEVFSEMIRVSSLDRKATSYLLNNVREIRTFLSGGVVGQIFDVPWLPVFLMILWFLHPLVGLLGLVAAAGLLGLAVLNEYTTHEYTVKANRHQSKAQEDAEASMRNNETVNALGMRHNIIARWMSHYTSALDEAQRGNEMSRIITAAAKSWRMLVQIAILAIGAYLVLEKQFTAGTMIAGSILLGRALAPVENAIDAWKQLSMARSAHDNLRTFFEEHAQKAEKTRLDIPPPKGNLSVEGLVYAYPGTNHAIIRGLNLEILAGEVVAIIGPSGAGKSTLARLLIGVLRPNAGSVRIDQIDIRNWERERLGPYVGYLPQDVELFRGTIAENIGRFTKLDSDAVVEAAKLSGVHDMIAALPDAYDTELGERGLGLSGGERQRVGLARAMYGHPVLLVLDEPNSNLDAESEERLLAVIRYMKSQGCTIVFIAHRPTMLQSADRIILMRQGRIEAMGPRDEILKRLVKPPAGPQPPSPPAIGNK